jgi:hypothetical protein
LITGSDMTLSLDIEIRDSLTERAAGLPMGKP